MPKTPPHDDTLNGNSDVVLELLNVIHDNESLTQRSMANALGIALGLANTYLKRCVRKGFVKVQQVPSNRYIYYLTPSGFTEKSRLTAEYLSSSFTFFRRAKIQCLETLQYANARNWQHVGLVGLGDLTEIFTLCSLGNENQIVGIYDALSKQTNFAGLRVVNKLEDLGNIDALIVTDTRTPQYTYDRLCEEFTPTRILTIPLLGISQPSVSEEKNS